MKKFFMFYLILTTMITVAILAPYSTHINDTLPNAIDPVFYAWNVGHDAQSFLQGGKNLLDTNIFYPEGNTLALSDTLYVQTAMVMPILAITNNPVLAENMYILATFVIAAFSMFFLAYYLTKNTPASALTGIFFAFSVPRLAQIGHMPALGSQWMPLFFLFLFQYLETGSWKHLWLTFLFYFLNITSSIYFGVFLMPAVGVAIFIQGITWIYHRNYQGISKILKTFAISLIPMLVILIVVLFPYLRLSAEYPGIKRGIDDTARLGAKLADYATVLPTSWLSDIGLRTSTNEEPLYPTVTLITLAAIGLIWGWKANKKYISFFLLSGIVAFLLSFGPYMDIILSPYKWFHLTAPYFYLYKVFPLLQIVRVPARLSILVIFSLASLASLGLGKMLNKKYAFPLALVILLIYLCEVWQVGTPSVQVPLARDVPPVYQWLAKQPDAVVVAEIPFRPELTFEPMELQLMHTYAETRDNNGYALETYRVYFSYFHKKRILNGYSSYFPQVYQDHATMLANFPTADAMGKLQKEGVRYIVVHGNQYTDRNGADVLSELTNFSTIKKIEQFGTDYVYELIAPHT